MPKSLLVFAVSFTPEKILSVGSRTPLEEFLFYFFYFLLFNCVGLNAHISNLNYKHILILKKNRTLAISGCRTPLIQHIS